MREVPRLAPRVKEPWDGLLEREEDIADLPEPRELREDPREEPMDMLPREAEPLVRGRLEPEEPDLWR